MALLVPFDIKYEPPAPEITKFEPVGFVIIVDVAFDDIAELEEVIIIINRQNKL